MLIIISYFSNKKSRGTKGGSWSSALFLFAYAICFTFAYLGLSAGTGALILFGLISAITGIWQLAIGRRNKYLVWFGLGLGILLYAGALMIIWRF